MLSGRTVDGESGGGVVGEAAARGAGAAAGADGTGTNTGSGVGEDDTCTGGVASWNRNVSSSNCTWREVITRRFARL